MAIMIIWRLASFLFLFCLPLLGGNDGCDFASSLFGWVGVFLRGSNKYLVTDELENIDHWESMTMEELSRAFMMSDEILRVEELAYMIISYVFLLLSWLVMFMSQKENHAC